MKPNKVLLIVALLAILITGPGFFSAVQAASAPATVNLSVDAGILLQSGTANGARLGINTDYWWDDQANRVAGARPLSAALTDMGVKFWRYPGGEKADGYLWSLAPFISPNPKLARTDTRSNGDWPANDSTYWTGNTQAGGSFTHPIYDFDEFMTDCQAAGCTPIIVVAYDGIYKPATGSGQSLTRQQALDTSAAWVNYANNVKGYGIKYWEIGNETYFNQPGSGHDYMGIDPGRTTQANDFIEFCNNMKAQDATILCGVNTESQADFNTLLSIAHANIDFFDVHAYEAWPYVNYSSYANGTLNQNIKVDYAWNALQNYPADLNRIKIIVAETGAITFGINGTWTAADLGHALMNFESMAMLMQDPRVTATAFWNTHWMEQPKNNTWPNYNASEYDALKPDNSLSPQGWGIKLLSDYALDQMIGTTSSGKVRAYASKNASGAMNVWLVNKDTVASTVALTLKNYTAPASGTISVYKGTGSADMYPTFIQNYGSVPVNSNVINLALDPVSITIIQLSPTGQVATPTTIIPSPTFTATSAPGNPTPTNTPVSATVTPSACTGTTNIALAKTTTTSSVQKGGYTGSNAVDGNTSTRWWTLKGSSLPSEWIMVDLGSSQVICKTVLNQGDRWAKNYTVQVSNDNVNWTMVASTTSGVQGLNTDIFSAVSARYVRMVSTVWNNTSDRVKLIEFGIYK